MSIQNIPATPVAKIGGQPFRRAAHEHPDYIETEMAKTRAAAIEQSLRILSHDQLRNAPVVRRSRVYARMTLAVQHQARIAGLGTLPIARTDVGPAVEPQPVPEYAIETDQGLVRDPSWHSVNDVMRSSHYLGMRRSLGRLVRRFRTGDGVTEWAPAPEAGEVR